MTSDLKAAATHRCRARDRDTSPRTSTERHTHMRTISTPARHRHTYNTAPVADQRATHLQKLPTTCKTPNHNTMQLAKPTGTSQSPPRYGRQTRRTPASSTSYKIPATCHLA